MKTGDRPVQDISEVIKSQRRPGGGGARDPPNFWEGVGGGHDTTRKKEGHVPFPAFERPGHKLTG